MKKICRRANNRESRRRQRHSGAAENRAAGFTARHCDVGQHYVIGVIPGSKPCRPIAGYSAVQAFITAVLAYYMSGERECGGAEWGKWRGRKSGGREEVYGSEDEVMRVCRW